MCLGMAGEKNENLPRAEREFHTRAEREESGANQHDDGFEEGEGNFQGVTRVELPSNRGYTIRVIGVTGKISGIRYFSLN